MEFVTQVRSVGKITSYAFQIVLKLANRRPDTETMKVFFH